MVGVGSRVRDLVALYQILVNIVKPLHTSYRQLRFATLFMLGSPRQDPTVFIYQRIYTKYTVLTFDNTRATIGDT